MLGSVDLMQHSLRQHVLSSCVMLFARDTVDCFEDEFHAIHIVTSRHVDVACDVTDMSYACTEVAKFREPRRI